MQASTDPAGRGFAEPVVPKDMTESGPGGSAMPARASTIVIRHRGDSIEPVRSQVSRHLPGMVSVYCRKLPPLLASGPATVQGEIIVIL